MSDKPATLFDVEPRLRTYDQGKFYGSANWWAVKCLDCKTWITKYDHSEEQALGYAKGHRCK